MILDGHWKLELNRYARKLKFWSKLCRGAGTYAEHQVNKNLLYSAIIIRKLIEDEKDVRKQIENTSLLTPELGLLHYDLHLPVVEYEFDGDKDFILQKVITDYYHAGPRNYSINKKPKTICNYIIHSYIWNLAYESNKRGIIGFLTASDFDKEKKLYFVKLTDWINCIIYCKEKCNV